jgi:hypothetical protein
MVENGEFAVGTREFRRNMTVGCGNVRRAKSEPIAVLAASDH